MAYRAEVGDSSGGGGRPDPPLFKAAVYTHLRSARADFIMLPAETATAAGPAMGLAGLGPTPTHVVLQEYGFTEYLAQVPPPLYSGRILARMTAFPCKLYRCSASAVRRIFFVLCMLWQIC